MFARIANVNLKVGEGPGYARTVDREVMPVLRKLSGFRDQITLVSSDGKQTIGITLWDRREDADAYTVGAYQDVVKCLQKHIDGTPEVTTYEVTNSTAHAITTLKAGA